MNIDNKHAPPSVPTRPCRELELSAHLAEYSSLTTRCTYWIAIQYALWPVLAGLLTFAASLWNTVAHGLLIWTSAAAVQLLLLGWNTSLGEIYKAVRYLEREVRPAVQAIVGEQPIWRYETYNAEQRRALPIWWEYGTPAACFILLILLAATRFPFQRADVFGLAGNALLLVCTTAQTIAIIHTRQNFFPTQAPVQGKLRGATSNATEHSRSSHR